MSWAPCFPGFTTGECSTSAMDFDLNALRAKASEVKRARAEQQRFHEQREEASRLSRERKQQEERQNEAFSNAQTMLRAAFTEAAESGVREATVFCSIDRTTCNKDSDGYLFLHHHSIRCMAPEYQQLMTLASAEGLRCNFSRKNVCRRGLWEQERCGGIHSESCWRYVISIKF